MGKKRQKRTPRPCPACRPGIYCAACQGRGHSPQTRIVPPPGFGGQWSWRGSYRSAHVNDASLRTFEHDQAANEHVVNAQGELAPASRDRRYATPLKPEEIGFLQEGGRSPVRTKDGRAATGMTAHRGVLHPDEYVDAEELTRLIERELGSSRQEAADVYGRSSRGPLPGALRGRRDDLDRRLARAEEGTLALLARALDVPARTLQKAAQRGQRLLDAPRP